MADLARIVRESGLVPALKPVEAMRQEQAVSRVIDNAGGITPTAADPFRTPMVMHWTPGETGRKRAGQSGTAVTLAAYAATPPSTGNCIVALTMVTALEGSRTIGTCQITNGQSIGEAQLNQPIPAGAWIGAVVSSAEGASNVSISLTVRTTT